MPGGIPGGAIPGGGGIIPGIIGIGIAIADFLTKRDLTTGSGGFE
jgi:hypothetical protein